MDVEQARWKGGAWAGPGPLRGAQLALVFGSRDELGSARWYEELRRRYPSANVVACSTAGEILGDDVGDPGIVATAIRFERTPIRVSRVNVREYMDSESAGAYLAKTIEPAGLAHVLLFCDGQLVNGSDVARGLARGLPRGVAITGGLAGDGARFQRTYVCANGPAMEGNIAAVALYGSSLRVGYGSLGGWEAFGKEMLVTRSRGNVLEQLDGQPALDAYADIIGPDAARLPASGLLYPLDVAHGTERVVRTLLQVDARHRTLTFAGDVPVGSRVRLMKADFAKLVEGASGAAAKAVLQRDAQLALLISCVGRRLVLQERTADEVAAVRKVVGASAALAGFYSYGEICPSAPHAACELHNQTMTITTLRED